MPQPESRTMKLAERLRRGIRPSRTQHPSALRAKSLLNALVFFALFMIALPWLAHALLPAALSRAAPIRHTIGIALGLAGGLAWLWCLEEFSRHGGTPLASDAPRELVTVGPFGQVRNPIMTAELAVIWAEAIGFGSLGLGLYAAAITGLAHWLVVHVEEPELRSRFGERYREYTRSVPRWLPRLQPQGRGR